MRKRDKEIIDRISKRKQNALLGKNFIRLSVCQSISPKHQSFSKVRINLVKRKTKKKKKLPSFIISVENLSITRSTIKKQIRKWFLFSTTRIYRQSSWKEKERERGGGFEKIKSNKLLFKKKKKVYCGKLVSGIRTPTHKMKKKPLNRKWKSTTTFIFNL